MPSYLRTVFGAANDLLSRGSSGASGQDLAVTSFMANDIGPHPFPAVVGQTYSSITGFGYMVGATDATAIPKLAPLSASDLKP